DHVRRVAGVEERLRLDLASRQGRAPVGRALRERDVGVVGLSGHDIGSGPGYRAEVEVLVELGRRPEPSVLEQVIDVVHQAVIDDQRAREPQERALEIEDYLARVRYVDRPVM